MHKKKKNRMIKYQKQNTGQKSIASAYLGLVKHPEICVHVHGFLLRARLLVQFGGLIEFGLVAVNISQEHHVVIFSPLLSFLVE